MATISQTTDSGPVREDGRITSLDLVRGVAVLGILLMNAVYFKFGQAPYFNLSAGGSETWLDWSVGIFGEIFVDQKFMGLFSLLFGAGMILFIDRANERGRRAVALNLWRNALLLLIGILHFMLWDGDVLMAYAVSSVFLIAPRKLPNWALITVGAAVFAAIRWQRTARSVHRRYDQRIAIRTLDTWGDFRRKDYWPSGHIRLFATRIRSDSRRRRFVSHRLYERRNAYEDLSTDRIGRPFDRFATRRRRGDHYRNQRLLARRRLYRPDS